MTVGPQVQILSVQSLIKEDNYEIKAYENRK